jgi:CO/xanthine dehydrogenase Mo-binding subunit
VALSRRVEEGKSNILRTIRGEGCFAPSWVPARSPRRDYYAPPQATFASGCHAAIVEMDAETGDVTCEKYVVVLATEVVE